MPTKSPKRGKPVRIPRMVPSQEKALAALTKRVSTLHIVANECLKEARSAAGFASAGTAFRSTGSHSPAKHDPEFSRALEGLAAALEALSGVEQRWRSLAKKTDALAEEILAAKRADLECVTALDDAAEDVERLAASHDSRAHPKAPS